MSAGGLARHAGVGVRHGVATGAPKNEFRPLVWDRERGPADPGTVETLLTPVWVNNQQGVT